jgi:LAO/AO transport system kinase
MHPWQQLKSGIINGDTWSLARAISLVENEVPGYEQFLEDLPIPQNKRIVGITGPPGAGKSTLADCIIGEWVNRGKKVGVLCVDPSSPFNLGALLGDRIRMSEWYMNPQVYIRSLAARGSLGGLHPKIIEITELMKAAPFDYILVETVGVGQSEIEIAGLADTTIVVLVPEAGDEVQTMKAGLMEIADIFAVNKADRPEADIFVKNLRQMLAPVYTQEQWDVPIVKTIAITKEGIPELFAKIEAQAQTTRHHDKKIWLLAEKTFRVIQNRRMKDVDKNTLRQQIDKALHTDSFNLYKFIQMTEQQMPANNNPLPKVAGCEPSCEELVAGKTYAWCTCGLSEKQPFCDGKHKTLAYEENGETILPFKSLKITVEKDTEAWLCHCKQTGTPPYCDGSHHSACAEK